MNEDKLDYPGNNDSDAVLGCWINRVLFVIFIVGICFIVFLKVDFYTKSISCILWTSIVLCIKLIAEGEDD